MSNIELESPFANASFSKILDRFREADEFEDESAFDRADVAPKLPSDEKLLEGLKRHKKLPGVAELAKALRAMSKPKEFVPLLTSALGRTPWVSEQGSSALAMFRARLGAEAFVRNVLVPEANRAQVGFIDHPSRLLDSPSPTERVYFLHFACERLRSLAPLPETPSEHLRWLECSAALFSWFQGELRRDYGFTGLEKGVLLAYRRLSAALIWKHYQALFDHWLTQARKSPSIALDASKALKSALAIAAVTNLTDDEAHVSSFRYNAHSYRDYFFPSAKTDFAYSFFSKHATASKQKPLQMAFSRAYRRREEQLAFVDDVIARSTKDAIPSFHRSESWQDWLKQQWDGARASLSAEEHLKRLLQLVAGYFELFTLHVPNNLRESCKDASYLVRAFPRAVNGAAIHDCAVYAVRWLHILGKLIDPKQPAAELTRVKIHLVEMPVHVGVLIRLCVSRKQELLISINNGSVSVYPLDPNEDLDVSAARVVSDAFLELATTYVLHPISASPTDPSALWRETCLILEKRLVLPYAEATEPHLRYLEYKARLAGIATRLSLEANRSFAELSASVAKLKKNSAEARTQLASKHAQFVRQRVVLASAEYTKDVKPIADAMADDLKAKAAKLPKRARVAQSPHVPPWELALLSYEKDVVAAAQKNTLAKFRTDRYFPEDDFVASYE